eukprot:6612296-Lingulodinium_polyedra.AAC.1
MILPLEQVVADPAIRRCPHQDHARAPQIAGAPHSPALRTKDDSEAHLPPEPPPGRQGLLHSSG